MVGLKNVNDIKMTSCKNTNYIKIVSVKVLINIK
jgi:hypothetical protein